MQRWFNCQKIRCLKHKEKEIKIFIFIKNILKIFKVKLDKCNFLGVMKIIGLGLIVNVIYGAYEIYDVVGLISNIK